MAVQHGSTPDAHARPQDVLRAAPGPTGAGFPPRTSHQLASSPFPLIGDYAFLSDCEVTALVAPGGSVEWMCVPRLDSASIFGAILDRGAGSFRFGPSDVTVPAARRYLPGTNVLETSWNVGEGWVIVRDALLMGPWHATDPSRSNYRRAPTDYAASHVLVRTVRCVNGEVQLQMDCEPVFDYGRRHGQWRHTDRGYHEAVISAEGGPPLRLTTDMRVGFEGPRAVARTLLKDGDVRFVALSWGDAVPPTSYDDAYERLVWTAHHWQHWLAGGRIPDHPWQSYLSRSALTLKGLTYAPTGAIAAAATSSLPETPGGERNYDYRYSWIRDATFALWGLFTLGFDWEANDFFHFITDLAERDGGDLQIVYGVGGETDLTEHELAHLHGYDGARPVRVGNAAYQQQQNDLWGAVLDSVYLHVRSRDRLDDRVWRVLHRQVEEALAHWREPDRGVWEVRGEPKHFTSSKVMCWVAADRGARLARLREDWELASRWQAAADEIHADICTHALDERGVFVQHYGTDALDASMLLMPLVRFLPPNDPRIRATVLAIADELTDEGLVLRYRTKETDDGFAGEEGAFTICSFWLVSALAEIGEIERSRQLCERLLGYASPLLLFAEELDPRNGRHLGNFPQAFTHLALINAVMHVIRIEEEQRLSGEVSGHGNPDQRPASI